MLDLGDLEGPRPMVARSPRHCGNGVLAPLPDFIYCPTQAHRSAPILHLLPYARARQKAMMAQSAQMTASPNRPKRTDAIACSLNAPTNIARTAPQVAAPATAPRITAKSSATDRRCKVFSCAWRAIVSASSAPSSALVTASTLSPTRANRVAKTLRRVAMPDSRSDRRQRHLDDVRDCFERRSGIIEGKHRRSRASNRTDG
jgi:hypothetical protein